MKKLLEGGLICLLSCFCWKSAGQGENDFIKFTDPDAPAYGKVLSPVLSAPAQEQLRKEKWSFPAWSSFYQVKTEAGVRAVLGAYHLEKNRIAFVPRFLPDPAIAYTVTFDFNAMADLLKAPALRRTDSLFVEVVSFGAREQEAGRITGVYPHINVVPANILRFYLYFSQPMGFENPYEHLTLLDQQGAVIKDAFVELPQGLWNNDRTRLTVLFHPGRVKQGVGPNREEGPVLMEGQLYELQVSNQWKDGTGTPLQEGLGRKFFVAQARRGKLRKKDWTLTSVCKQECLLYLNTGDIPDFELMDDMISMRNAAGESIPFAIFPEANGSFLIRSESFIKVSTVTMIINPRMEDISGNTFLRAFDVKDGAKVKKEQAIELSIDIK